jgi:hypothetical protein
MSEGTRAVFDIRKINFFVVVVEMIKYSLTGIQIILAKGKVPC